MSAVPFRVLEIGDKSVLLIDLPGRYADFIDVRKYYRVIEQMIETSRADFDAVVILHASSMGLRALPVPIRTLALKYGFKPMRGKTKTGEVLGISYWIMELGP